MRLSASTCSPELPSAFPLHLEFVVFVRCHAVRQHIAVDDRDDCAQGFSLHLLQRNQRVLSFASPAYLNRCTANFARNFRRNQMRITRHEITWPQHADEDGVAADQEFAASASAPDTGLIRQEAQSRLCAAMQSLTPVQRQLVRRHFFHDESFVELAERMDSTPDSVRMTVTRGLKRLRTVMKQQGMTEKEACEYLVEMTARGG